jgi:ribosomal protein L40E
VDPPTGTLRNDGGVWTIVVNGPYTVQAQWSLDYFPLILLFGGTAAAVTAIAIGTAVGYKRGLFNGRPRTLPPQKAESTTSTSTVGVVCTKCGNKVPKGVDVCGKCGTPIAPLQPRSKDDTVYDYIVKHQGVISLRAASKDLGISVDELKEITGRLKKDGRLG